MKKTIPKRQYHDGDIVEFYFEPNSLDIQCCEVILAGIVSGVLYEKDGICYKIQLRDKKRDIFGDMVVSEGHINRMIDTSVSITK